MFIKKTIYFLLFFCVSTYCLVAQNNINERDSAYYYFNKSLSYSNQNKADLSYKSALKAKSIYKKRNCLDSVFICNLKIYDIISSQNGLDKNPINYLQECESYQTSDTSKIIALKYRLGNFYFDQNKPEVSSKYYLKSIELCKKYSNEYLTSTFINLALLYSLQYVDSANIYFEKALKVVAKQDTDKLVAIYINQANLFQNNFNYDEAIAVLKKAENIKLEKYRIKYKKIIHEKLSHCYKALNEFDKALIHKEKYIIYKDSIDASNQNIAISDLDKKYKTAEKDKQILVSEAKRKQNQNLFYGALAILFFSGIIYFQNLKNSRKKRLLAEQQKELEKQKNLTLIKEQEIVTINAMVDGQEKERIRIAEDLHDNIGSVLATLKLHFENLKLNRDKKHFNQDELYQKTEKLIDETYFKVRNLAHAKNAGVIANKGLLSAVKIMATKISDANKITIEVLDFGLEKHLENALELTIFRIIQELTTNIIKHAQATHATINLSLYDNNLNIIIEDNGKGFVLAKEALKNDGMGLGSIQTRINHLNGTFEIDSTVGKGTSILMNVPV